MKIVGEVEIQDKGGRRGDYYCHDYLRKYHDHDYNYNDDDHKRDGDE